MDVGDPVLYLKGWGRIPLRAGFLGFYRVSPGLSWIFNEHNESQ